MSDTTQQNAQPLDFRKREPISRRRLQILNAVHERYAKELTATLSAFLRMPTEVLVKETSQCSHQQFLQGAANPGCHAALSIGGSPSGGTLELRPELLGPIVERLLGGELLPSTLERAMTEIELQIVHGFLQLLIVDLTKAWKTVMNVDIRLGTPQTYMETIAAAAAKEQVIALTLHMKAAEVEGNIRVALAAAALERAFPSVEETPSATLPGDVLMTHQLRLIPVDITIETPQSLYPIEAIVSLQPGDTLLLDHRNEWPLELKVCGKSKLHVQPERDSRHKAFAVVAGSATEEAHERRIQ